MKISKQRSANKGGFSLVEVVIAIGIVAVLLTTFMAVFGPAQQHVVRALGVGEVNRLTTTLEKELSYVRPGEQYDSAFEKAFEWISESGSARSAVVLYQYQADPNSENNDGTLKAAAAKDVYNKVPGVDFITQAVVRRLGDSVSEIREELTPGVVQGSVYAVRLTQLVSDEDSNELKVGSAGRIVDPSGSTASSSENYEGSYIALQAEFFRLPTNLSGYVTGGKWDFENIGEPVAVQNIAVRR